MSQDEKLEHHQKLLLCANNFGGKNFFLHLLESLRATKPHPLTSSNHAFYMELGEIRWNKVIFNDKLQLLLKARMKESEQNNLLPNKEKSPKEYKKVLNLLRTLKPIVFHVKPQNKEEGPGFFFQAFEQIDEEKTKLNVIFDVLFFCSVEEVKYILNYDKTKN